jgi:hypothetical protein
MVAAKHSIATTTVSANRTANVSIADGPWQEAPGRPAGTTEGYSRPQSGRAGRTGGCDTSRERKGSTTADKQKPPATFHVTEGFTAAGTCEGCATGRGMRVAREEPSELFPYSVEQFCRSNRGEGHDER